MPITAEMTPFGHSYNHIGRIERFRTAFRRWCFANAPEIPVNPSTQIVNYKGRYHAYCGGSPRCAKFDTMTHDRLLEKASGVLLRDRCGASGAARESNPKSVFDSKRRQLKCLRPFRVPGRGQPLSPARPFMLPLGESRVDLRPVCRGTADVQRSKYEPWRVASLAASFKRVKQYGSVTKF